MIGCVREKERVFCVKEGLVCSVKERGSGLFF